MRGRDVFVVGAGNSAGQAAVHLAQYARSVTMLVRGESLHATMSEYLVTVIAQTPNIRVRVATEVIGGAGDGYLEALTIRDRDTGRTEELPASGLFVLIGAEPRTEWLAGTLRRSAHGYVLTGRDVAATDDSSAYPRRAPMPLETSMPGVFAVGDVRYRSIKRVASAVGEDDLAHLDVDRREVVRRVGPERHDPAIARYSRPSSSFRPCPVKYSRVRSSRRRSR
jgi:thioredoxin reductase (NADPH)